MAIQDLKVWAETLLQTSPDNITQRMDLSDDEFRDGLLRRVTFDNPQINQLGYLLSLAAAPALGAPFLIYDGAPVPSNAIVAEGQSITEQDNFILYCAYGDTLPDLTGEGPTGFTYYFRDNNEPYIPPVFPDPIIIVATGGATDGFVGFRASTGYVPMSITTAESKDGLVNIPNQGIYAINTASAESSKWILSGANALVEDSTSTLPIASPEFIFSDDTLEDFGIVAFAGGTTNSFRTYDDGFSPVSTTLDITSYEAGMMDRSGKWFVAYDTGGAGFDIFDRSNNPPTVTDSIATPILGSTTAADISYNGSEIAFASDSGFLQYYLIDAGGEVFDGNAVAIVGTGIEKGYVKFNIDGTKLAVMTASNDTLTIYDTTNSYAVLRTIVVPSYTTKNFGIAWSDNNPNYITVASRTSGTGSAVRIYDVDPVTPVNITGELPMNSTTIINDIILTDALTTVQV